MVDRDRIHLRTRGFYQRLLNWSLTQVGACRQSRDASH